MTDKARRVHSEESERDGQSKQQTPSDLNKVSDRQSKQQTPSDSDGKSKEEEVHSEQSERDGQSKQQTPSVTDSSTSDTSVVSDSSVVVLSDPSAKHEVEFIVLSSDVTDTDGKGDGQKEVKEESPDKSNVTITQTKLEIKDFPPQGRLESRSKYICRLAQTFKGNQYSYKKNKNIKRGSSTTSSSENECDGHKKEEYDGSTSSGSHRSDSTGTDTTGTATTWSNSTSG